MAAPSIHVLGDVHIETDQPRPAMWRRAREIITFLALFPDSSEGAFTEAIFPGEMRSPKLRQRRNEYLRIARRWMGDDEHARPWIPLVAEGSYTLRAEVVVDWTCFTDLVDGAPASRTTKELLAALSLVKGRPLTGIEEDHWEWAQALKTEMCWEIAGVAHELLERGQRDGDHLLALRAVEVGLQAVPEDSRMWDRAITIAKATGGSAAANAMARRRARALEDE